MIDICLLIHGDWGRANSMDGDTILSMVGLVREMNNIFMEILYLLFNVKCQPANVATGALK
jgi:hypothetical protein